MKLKKNNILNKNNYRKTRPIFIVGSGRSGSKMLCELLNQINRVESNHEYMCTHIQPLAVKYYMKILSREKVLKQLGSIYSSAIEYSKKPIWIDSSNKVSWVIDILFELFPNARFVHIVRDGRKVVSSFYNKLNNECYDDKSVSILTKWYNNPDKYIEPPPEKKYWWGIPIKGNKYYHRFKKFDQFERICFHWGEVTRTIVKEFNNLPDKSFITLKLEDIISKKKKLKLLLKFIGIKYHPEYYKILKRPQNIIKKEDKKLTPKQKKKFYDISGDMMKLFRYDKSTEYDVKY